VKHLSINTLERVDCIRTVCYSCSVNCEVYVSTKRGNLLEGFKLFYEEISIANNKPVGRLRRVRSERVNNR
jgi:anaerobic selenocysteine-containing dehydrogenase